MSIILKEKYKAEHNQMMEIPEQYRIWKNLPFTTIAINVYEIGEHILPHIDSWDIACAIWTLGNYKEGGELANLTTRELYTMKASMGTALKSREHYHASYPASERKYSIAFFAKTYFHNINQRTTKQTQVQTPIDTPERPKITRQTMKYNYCTNRM